MLLLAISNSTLEFPCSPPRAPASPAPLRMLVVAPLDGDALLHDGWLPRNLFVYLSNDERRPSHG